MSAHSEFEEQKRTMIAQQGDNRAYWDLALRFMRETAPTKYAYNFTWLGRPIIQFPQDMVALQELVWQVKPDLIIETGIAHGGSLILSASLLAMLDYSEAVESDSILDPKATRRRVLGIDIDIREHNRAAIEAHPMSHRIDMLQGSSISPEVISKVRLYANGKERVLVFLDSNHTHEHVLAELTAYAPLVSVGSYCVVFDTIIDDLPGDFFPDRSWGKENNPRTAAVKFLTEHPEFEIDQTIPHKLLITVARDGYLKRIR
jgi:cephalosporin hydroxylase